MLQIDPIFWKLTGRFFLIVANYIFELWLAKAFSLVVVSKIILITVILPSTIIIYEQVTV